MFVLFFYIPPTYYQIFAQSGHLLAKLFLAESNFAQKHTMAYPHFEQKKKTFLSLTNNNTDMNGRGYMLHKHLQKFAQWEQLFQELSSYNICSSFKQEEKEGGRGGKTNKDFPHSQPNFLNLSCHIKQSLLYRTHPLASLSLNTDHRSDGRQCAQTPFPPSNQRSTTKEGGWKFFLSKFSFFGDLSRYYGKH